MGKNLETVHTHTHTHTHTQVNLNNKINKDKKEPVYQGMIWEQRKFA